MLGHAAGRLRDIRRPRPQGEGENGEEGGQDLELHAQEGRRMGEDGQGGGGEALREADGGPSYGEPHLPHEEAQLEEEGCLRLHDPRPRQLGEGGPGRT